MICCSLCFKDIVIQAMIVGLNKKGNCETCEEKDGFIYDTEEVNDDLVQAFDGLLDTYTPLSSLPTDFPKEKLNLLNSELSEKWNIFNLEKDKIYTLIKNICKERYTENPSTFDEPVGILASQQENYLLNNSILRTYEWENFVTAIRTENRFHTDYFNKEILNDFLNYSKKEYHNGEIFYRARISNKEGISIKDMGAPPIGLASDGRVNASGISCLYLSNDKETTINEIRAGNHDYVTIGKFELKEDISVVNLLNLHQISPFLTISNIDFTKHAINRRHLEKLGNEIAKPLRRQDSPLDYLPTQYISDFIKSKGYQGIEYKSTMNENGRNLAIFNTTLFECIGVSIVKIKEIIYRT